MGQTIAEKVLSRQNLAQTDCFAGDLVDARVDGLFAIFYELVRASYERIGFSDGPPIVFDPERVFLMDEHVQPPRTIERAQANAKARRDAMRLNLPNYRSEMGICHQMMIDDGHVRPGELIVGNDSHATTYGALNAVSTGIGSDEVAYAWAFGELYFTVPETIKLVLSGTPRPYPFAKDIILHLAGLYGDSFAEDYSVEFAGPFSAAMDIASRMTLASHAEEVGAKFGIFLADEKTHEFVRARSDRPYQPVEPDPDAVYAKVIELDCDSFDFQVAKPFGFGNVGPLSDVAGVKIDQARIGSCANGRFEDIEIAARLLRGRHVAPGVSFQISPASMAVFKQCADAGIIGDLIEAGVQFGNPGCSICASDILLNDQVCITSTTRNYHGRFGGASSYDAEIYLAGPLTVAAAAIAGKIVDPREFLDV